MYVCPEITFPADNEEDEWFDALEDFDVGTSVDKTTPTTTTPSPAEFKSGGDNSVVVSSEEEVSSATKLELKFDIHKVRLRVVMYVRTCTCVDLHFYS